MRETYRLFQSTGLRYAVVGRVDALEKPLPSAEPVLSAVVAVVVAHDENMDAIAEWPADEADPFAALALAVCPPMQSPRTR